MARHPEDKLLLQKEVITACATYTVLRQTLIFFFVHYRKANSSLPNYCGLSHTLSSLFKDCLVRAKFKTILLNEPTGKVLYSDSSHSRCNIH